MLRIVTSASAEQAKKYFSEGLRREGYYSEGQEMAGEWGGLGAARLGLAGPVGKEAFSQLCDNINPDTGEALTPRTKSNRRPGYDFNFNAPKSVTLVYEWTGDERILEAFRKAIRQTMRDVQRDAATRVRSHGRDEDRKTGNLIWAEYIHFTARPVDGFPDPHLHAHIFVPNATFDEEEKRWKAVQLGKVKEDASYYEAAFRARFAKSLCELGYQTIPVDGSFELAGISRSLIEANSRRSKVVEEKAKELGKTSAKEKDGLAALTREKKIKEMTRAELRAIWWGRLSPEHLLELQSVGKSRDWLPGKEFEGMVGHIQSSELLGTKVPENRPMEDKRAVAFALQHIFERASIITERELITEALKWGFGVASVEGVTKVVRGTPLIRVEKNGEVFLTTREVLEEENRIVARCKDGKDKFAAIYPGWEIQDAKLGVEQQVAVLHVLKSKDFITGITGKAGTGKTTLLHEAKRGIEVAGQTLLVLAPTAEEVHDDLRKRGFENSHTVAKLLVSESLQKQARGAVWWVDEAGLLSTRTADKLIALAEKLEARLVFVGDVGQHHAVDRGQAFDLLQRYGDMPVAAVEEIQRQKGFYKKFVELIVARDYEQAFKLLERMDAINEGPFVEMVRQLAEDYVTFIERGKDAWAVSPTHRECDQVTQAIRSLMKAKGMIKDGKEWPILRDLAWTDAMKSDARQYCPGLVVRINSHLKGFSLGEQIQVTEVREDRVIGRDRDDFEVSVPLSVPTAFNVCRRETIEISEGDMIKITTSGYTKDGHRLNNGNTYQVDYLSPDGKIVLNNGWRLDKDFPHLEHGYTGTSHSSQGKTVDWVFVAQSGLCGSQAADANQFYVSITRGKEGTKLYTDGLEELKEQVCRVHSRPMAMDLLRERTGPIEYSISNEAKASKELGRLDKEAARRLAEREAEMNGVQNAKKDTVPGLRKFGPGWRERMDQREYDHCNPLSPEQIARNKAEQEYALEMLTEGQALVADEIAWQETIERPDPPLTDLEIARNEMERNYSLELLMTGQPPELDEISKEELELEM